MVKKDKNKKDKSKVKIDKLKVNRETVKDLTDADAQKVRGGYGFAGPTDTICSNDCRSPSFEPASPNCDTGQCKTVQPAPVSDGCGSIKVCGK